MTDATLAKRGTTNSVAVPRIVGSQTWTDLLFAHWKIDPNQMQSLLPEGLTVDTFDDAAWLALVPFSMERVRPWWSPAVPGISWFLETNVRTYVRHESGQSGVWFFSLDANHRLAVAVARRFWHLNYVHSELAMSVLDGRLSYSGKRSRNPDISYQVTAEVDRDAELQTADPGSLEHFLLERYRLFAVRPDGRLLTGQVHHEPYQFVPVQSADIQQSLTAAAGLPIAEQTRPDHLAYSPGVDVKVSAIHLI